MADERVSIEAFSLEPPGDLRLVVDNHSRALEVLGDHRYQVREREAIVLSVAPGPGGLAPALTLLGETGVNVEYAYGSAGRGSQGIVIIGVADALRAAAGAGL